MLRNVVPLTSPSNVRTSQSPDACGVRARVNVAARARTHARVETYIYTPTEDTFHAYLEQSI